MALGLSQATLQAQNTLFTESFDTDTSAAWDVFGGSTSGTQDYTVLFGFDYSTNTVVKNGVTSTIPPAPNGGGKGVKMWVNKNDNVTERAAVSIYPKGKTFTGEFALKFDMWLNYNGGAGGGSGSTEFATFGINHAGDKVVWADTPTSVPDAADGAWFAVTGESGAASDYRAFYGDGSGPATRITGSTAFLDRDNSGIAEDEVIGTEAADFPLFTLFPSPEYETEGMPGKHWVQVEIRQRTNDAGSYTVTWLMNNYVIAEHSEASAFNVISGNIMLGNMDIFSSIANPKEDNYVIYDNVRVVDLNSAPRLPILTIVTNNPTASEPSNAGSLTITRTGDATVPLTVNYRVTGSAQAGVDYTSLGGGLTFAAGQTSTNLAITPLNDLIGEADELVIVTLVGSTNYDLYTNISATVTLQDDGDVPVAAVSALRTNAYEANPNSFASFQIRLTNPSSSSITIPLTFSGTAVGGTDFTGTGSSVTFAAGETNTIIEIRPVNNTNTQSSARSVTLTLQSGAGYVLGTNASPSVYIRDDDFVPAGTLVYSEDFETDAAGRWNVNGTPGADNPADLFFDYSAVGIPPAPRSAGGSSHGSRLQANLSGGVLGGVSISPKTLSLTNDYVLRFDSWQNYNGPVNGGGSGSTQMGGAGIGTTGLVPLYHSGTPEGVWFAATGDAGHTVDYRAYSTAAATGTGYADASGVWAAGVRDGGNAYYYEFGLNQPPAEQTAIYPSQAGSTLAGAQAFAWRDVVIQKLGNTVTWYIDGKLIATVAADATNFVGGNIALLHSDINAGSSSDPNSIAMAFGLFDNVRVYQIAAQPSAPVRITGIRMINNGSAVQIDFEGGAQDTASAFTLQASAVASGGFTDAPSATITQVSPGKFRAVIVVSGQMHFYRIRR